MSAKINAAIAAADATPEPAGFGDSIKITLGVVELLPNLYTVLNGVKNRNVTLKASGLAPQVIADLTAQKALADKAVTQIAAKMASLFQTFSPLVGAGIDFLYNQPISALGGKPAPISLSKPAPAGAAADASADSGPEDSGPADSAPDSGPADSASADDAGDE
jgi:hypothetical protein